jgi:hypothetical protein
MKLTVSLLASMFAVLAAGSASAELYSIHGNNCIKTGGGSYSNTQAGIGPTTSTAVDVMCPLSLPEYNTVYYAGAYVAVTNNGNVGTALTCTLTTTTLDGGSKAGGTATAAPKTTGVQHVNIDAYPGYLDAAAYLTCHIPQNTRLTSVRIDWEGYWQ